MDTVRQDTPNSTWDIYDPWDQELLLWPIRSQIVIQSNTIQATKMLQRLQKNVSYIIQLAQKEWILEILQWAYTIKQLWKWSIEGQKTVNTIAEFTKTIIWILNKDVSWSEAQVDIDTAANGARFNIAA